MPLPTTHFVSAPSTLLFLCCWHHIPLTRNVKTTVFLDVTQSFARSMASGGFIQCNTYFTACLLLNPPIASLQTLLLYMNRPFIVHMSSNCHRYSARCSWPYPLPFVAANIPNQFQTCTHTHASSEEFSFFSHPNSASRYLQQHIESAQEWCKNQKTRRSQKIITRSDVCNLGLLLDRKINRNSHTRLKTQELYRRYELLRRLLRLSLKLTTKIIFTICKTIIQDLCGIPRSIWDIPKTSIVLTITCIRSSTEYLISLLFF